MVHSTNHKSSVYWPVNVLYSVLRVDIIMVVLESVNDILLSTADDDVKMKMISKQKVTPDYDNSKNGDTPAPCATYN